MKKYAYQIDTLRLVAMICVFCTHCFMLKNTGQFGNEIYEKYFVFGGHAVEFFIMLSGFLAAYTFKPFDTSDRRQYKEYIKHKALRLFPLHWVCMLLFLPLTYCFFGEGKLLRALIPTALLLQSVAPGLSEPINGASWTLSVLFVLFLFTPLMMRWIGRFRSLKVCLALIILSLLLENVFYSGHEALSADNLWLFYNSPHSRILNFFEGLMLGHIVRTFQPSRFFVRYASVLEILTISVFLYAVTTFRGMSFCILFYGPMLFMIYIMFLGNGIVSSVLAHRVLRPFSKLAFSFYMIHYLFIGIGMYVAKEEWHNYDNMPFDLCVKLLTVTFVVTFVAAWLLHELVEKRLTRYIRESRFFKRL